MSGAYIFFFLAKLFLGTEKRRRRACSCARVPLAEPSLELEKLWLWQDDNG